MSKLVKLYGGEVTLEFNEDVHAYIWREKNKPVAGVTKILEMLNKMALPQWAANCAVDYMKQAYVQLREQGGEIEPTAFLSLCDEAKAAHRRLSKAAADIGSIVHQFAESVLANGRASLPADPQAAKGAAAFMEWYSAHKIEPIHIERMVMSRTHWYAGTVDFFGHIDGELCVLDFKTSSGLYLEMPLQLAAYAVAISEETGDRIDNGWIVRLDKKTGKPTPHYIPLRHHLKDAWLRIREAQSTLKGVEALVEEVKESTKQGTKTSWTQMTSTQAAARG